MEPNGNLLYIAIIFFNQDTGMKLNLPPIRKKNYYKIRNHIHACHISPT